MRALRIEKNLSQDGLAALCPPTRDRAGNVVPHKNSWLSKIETDKYEPSLDDLRALALALDVSVGWLVTGDSTGDSEFIARLRGMEGQMDERGRREVLATAQRQVEEAQAQDNADVMRRLLNSPEARAAYEALLAQEALERQALEVRSAPTGSGRGRPRRSGSAR